MSPDSLSPDKKRRRRTDYLFFLSCPTRWSDNDQYAHVNNAVYYHLFDAIITTYLVQHCALVPVGPDSGADSDSDGNGNGNQIGLVVSSFCEFFSPLSFPDVLDLGLKVAHLGKSSVTYEIGVFKSKSSKDADGSEDAPAVVGGYTQVFVDKRSRTSVAMSARTRAGLEKLITRAAMRPKL